VDSIRLRAYKDGDLVKVAGLVARPLQHPLAEAYFLSLEDEFGFIPLIVWPSTYEEYKRELREPFMLVEGTISRREGTLNIVVQKVTIPKIPGSSLAGNVKLPRPVFR
jgi:error-prone DNA polymerase